MPPVLYLTLSGRDKATSSDVQAESRGRRLGGSEQEDPFPGTTPARRRHGRRRGGDEHRSCTEESSIQVRRITQQALLLEERERERSDLTLRLRKKIELVHPDDSDEEEEEFSEDEEHYLDDVVRSPLLFFPLHSLPFSVSVLFSFLFLFSLCSRSSLLSRNSTKRTRRHWKCSCPASSRSGGRSQTS